MDMADKIIAVSEFTKQIHVTGSPLPLIKLWLGIMLLTIRLLEKYKTGRMFSEKSALTSVVVVRLSISEGTGIIH